MFLISAVIFALRSLFLLQEKGLDSDEDSWEVVGADPKKEKAETWLALV